MFLTHFKLTSQPFAERLAAEALWQDDRLRQGVARLRYVVEQATVGLLTGASGVGKSALLKRFIHELPRPQHQPVYVHLTRLPSAALLKLVVTELGEVPRRGKERLFQQILEKARQLEGTLVLILDEAHLLDGDALTDLRLLISSALDDAPPLKVVLAGQEPLRHTLRQSQHTALLNRIAVRHHLAALTKPETATYIDFQLKRAGGSEKLFDSAAVSPARSTIWPPPVCCKRWPIMPRGSTKPSSGRRSTNSPFPERGTLLPGAAHGQILLPTVTVSPPQ
jgi:general secretion pathway protein A